MSKLKKVLFMCTAYVLVAAIAVGGTLAYFTDRDSEVNTFTVGDVAIELNEEFRQGAELIPGVRIEKEATITNIGKNDAWVWMTVAVPAVLDDENAELGSANVLHWNMPGCFWNGYHDQDKFIQSGIRDGYLPEGSTGVADEDSWINDNKAVKQTINEIAYNVYTFKYVGAIVPGETTNIGLSKVFLDENVDIAPDGQWYIVENGEATRIDWNSNTNGNPMVYVSAYAIQKDKFGSVEEAYAAYNKQWGDNGSEYAPNGYMMILEDAVKAMTTLPDGTDIKAKVTSVVYGVPSDYPEVVNGDYESVKNGDMTTYYVPDGENYKVYMLSDSTIYAPEDSTGLFRDMTALKEVDLSNLDMSNVKSAKYLFRECTNLESIGDVSDWDVSNMTTSRGMFYNCKKLNGLDVSSWDVSNIEDAGWMFYNCASVTELDVANWDTSSMNFTKSMFYNNTKVTELAVSNWDMSDVTDTSYMFSYCKTLGDIDFSKWDVSNVQKFNNMFKHAEAMTTLDLSTWDTSSAVDMNHMFADCGNLRYLDISSFDTSKVTTMAWMFYEIEAEAIYVGDKWSLESIANLDEGVYSHKIATAPLVGGEGTTCRQIMDLDSKCVAENGARINATARYMIADGGSEKPGLLTYKAN